MLRLALDDTVAEISELVRGHKINCEYANNGDDRQDQNTHHDDFSFFLNLGAQVSKSLKHITDGAEHYAAILCEIPCGAG
jgi:hypothetical protein